jgi:hypothetical protein
MGKLLNTVTIIKGRREWKLPSQHPVGEYSEREQVSSAISGTTASNFGRQVIRGPRRGAAQYDAVRTGETEIHEYHAGRLASLRNKNVLRLDIPVH